jgi:hypothetical protein
VLELRGAGLADYARRNAGALQLGRVLDEGESQAQARAFVDGLSEVLAAIESVRVQVIPGEHTTAIEARLTRRRR